MHLASILLARVAASVQERVRAEAAMAERFAPRFNAVSLLPPGETQLSSIFRWMLDENETHGQGATFRDSFIADLLNGNPLKWSGSRVAAEVSTRDGLGRMDLLMVSGDDNRCVVIENKPWAIWQPGQLIRYLNDQGPHRPDVRVHALIGHFDAAASLGAHWASSTTDPLPSNVTASSFEDVAAWIAGCARACRAERVRSFLDDLTSYCRESILSEPSMEEIDVTADLILAGGDDALAAARSIGAALPLALSRAASGRLNGIEETVGSNPTVRVEIDGVVLNFVLFGDLTPWVGVTNKQWAPQLKGAVAWGQPERLWPRWSYVRKVGTEGQQLDEAARAGDLDAVARLIPVVARTMIGNAPAQS